MVYSVTSLSHFVLYRGASNVRADNYTVGSLILLVGCLELNILYWSALSWHKLSLTLATAHYSSLDNAVGLIAQCELSGHGWEFTHRPGNPAVARCYVNMPT